MYTWHETISFHSDWIIVQPWDPFRQISVLLYDQNSIFNMCTKIQHRAEVVGSVSEVILNCEYLHPSIAVNRLSSDLEKSWKMLWHWACRQGSNFTIYIHKHIHCATLTATMTGDSFLLIAYKDMYSSSIPDVLTKSHHEATGWWDMTMNTNCDLTLIDVLSPLSQKYVSVALCI